MAVKTVNELIIELQKQVERGYGDKIIFVEDSQEHRHINSVQQNTCSGIEPDYLFIMAGDWVEREELERLIEKAEGE